MAINVTGNIANIAVNTTSNVVTVSSSPVNVQLSATSVVSNTSVRQAINVSNLSGYGNLTYDSSNTSNGVIQYTGTANSDITTVITDNPSVVRGALSNTSPITYNSSTGVIGLEQTLDDLTLKKYQETVVTHSSTSGGLQLDVADGTVHRFTLTGNVTAISIANIALGGSATIFLNQDSIGGASLDTTTDPAPWTNWDFVNDFTTLSQGGGAFNILNVLYVNNTYYASLSNDTQVNPASLDVTGNITAGGNITGTYIIGDGSQLTNIPGHLTNAEVKTYIEANGLDASANLTTTANVSGAYILGDGSELTNIPTLTNAQVKTYLEGTGLTSTANITGSNVTGTYLYGDGSNISGLPQGDITGVTAGDGLTGGGTIGTVSLNVGAGTGITANPNNIAVNINAFDTDDLSEGGTNLYFTDARAVNATTGSFLKISADNFMTGSGVLTNTVIFSEPFNGAPKKLRLAGNTDIVGISTNDTVGLQFIANASANFGSNSNINLSSTTYVQGSGIINTSGNITGLNLEATTNVNTQTMVATGNITGANIIANYLYGDASNVTGLPQGDITAVTAGSGLTGGGTTGDVTLNVGAGTGITVNASDIAVDMSAFTTSDLAEGTNLYFTSTAARAVLSTATQAASGGGALSYDSGTGVFNFTPADSVTTATNATQVAITDDTSTDAPHYVTLSPAASGNQALEVSSSKLSFNPSSGVLQTDHISSDSGQPLQLKGQTDGIQLDKTIASADARILDFDTTGYSLADADLGTANVTTVPTAPQILTVVSGTAGQSTLTCNGLYTPLGMFIAIQQVGGGFGNFNTAYVVGASSLENALTTAGNNFNGGAPGATQIWDGSGNLSGWRVFDATQLSSTYLTGITGHVTGISGNTITLSEPLLNSITGGPIVLIPGAFSSTQNFGMAITGDTSTTGIPFDYALSIFNQYDLPETLSNVTVDRISYGTDSTINLANVVMRHIADVETGPDSAIKVPRSMLIGANVTPDLLSIGPNEAFAATSTLGITVEQDGVTDFGPLETTPQMKLMLNNYKTNSLASFTEYPKWTEFLGQSGNATVDMPYLGAPNLNFKLIGGTKPTKAATTGGDVVGRITYNALTGTGATGSDQFNPPASITTMVGGTGDLTAMANLDMYFQSTSATSYRNGPYVGDGQGSVASGSIPQTFLASKSGSTVLASNQAGSISLRPVRDYAQSGDASSYVDNRYADNLHDYHTFLEANWENPAGRTGSRVTINAKSGQTNGATPSGSDFNYDSVGDASLRFRTHNSDSSVKASWDIEASQSSNNLAIIDSLNDGSPTTVVDISGNRVHVDRRLKLQNLDTTAINALTDPQAGDVVFNTTLALVCVYNGTAWRKLNDAAM